MAAPKDRLPESKAPSGTTYHNKNPIRLVAPKPNAKPFRVAHRNGPLCIQCRGVGQSNCRGLMRRPKISRLPAATARTARTPPMATRQLREKKRTYNKTGERRRERIDDRLADPTTACLVPMHVGTSDPLDRVRSSRQSLLSDCHHDCRKNEHRIHPSRPTKADNDSKPDGGRECSYSRRHS
jgi:hypothetical protein